MSSDELAAHRIARIETRTVTSHYPRVVGKNARRGVHGSGPGSQVRIITTNRGAVGWGLSAGPDGALPALVGRRISDLFEPTAGVIDTAALPLDFPLHDLAARILGVPVYRMLGAAGPTSFPCYDGAIYMDDILPEDAPRGCDVILENCAADWALGYRAFKLKIGRGHQWMTPEEGLRRDIDVTRLVRGRYPDALLLVDGNDGFTCDQFLRYLDAVADCSLYWVEEPFPETRQDLQRLREFLAARSPQTLLADGEASPDIPHLIALAREGLVDVLLMDIVGLGFTAWRHWMPTFAEIGARTAPHTWGVPVKTLYAAQLGAGLGNVLILEGIPCVASDMDGSAYRLADGMLHVPDAPGFAVTLRDP